MITGEVAEVVVAISFPINTGLLILLNRRQIEGNHHTQTIRTLVEKQITPEGVTSAIDAAVEHHK